MALLPKKKTQEPTDTYIRIPVTLKDKDDKRIALAVKQAVEKREQRTKSWAFVIRLALRALAAAEGVKCK